MNGYVIITVGLLTAAMGSFLVYYGGHLNQLQANLTPGAGSRRFQFLNGYVVIGIGLLIVAVGTLVTFYGGQLNSRSDSKELEKKIDSTLGQLQAAQRSTSAEGPSGVTKTEQIRQIEDDFSRWATAFMEKRDERQRQFDQTRLDKRSVEARLSEKYRPLISQFISNLRKTIGAYNAKAGAKIEMNLPEITPNLFDGNYVGTVVFDSTHAWRITEFVQKPARESSTHDWH